VDRSLRRLGQLLVVMAALLGAIGGVTLALITEHTEPSMTVAAAGGVAVLAVHPPGSQPPASRTTTTGDPVDGSASSGDQRAEGPAGQARQDPGNAYSHGQGHRERPGKGKAKPGRGDHK
jgi:hypothetical protein